MATITAATSEESASRHWALRELPAFPPIATKLLQLLGDEDVAVKRVINLLRSDTAFSSEILRRANSALYGLSSQVSSLQHAVLLLGFDQVQALAMAVAMGAYLKPALRIVSLRRCWRHSLATALIGERLARAARQESDRAYTAGLLHDLGLLGLMVNYPNEYATLLAVTQENSFDLRSTEQALFDVDHCEAGGWLARQWRFPEDIEEAALHHHDTPGEGDYSLPAIIYWSSMVADSLGFEVIPPQQPQTLEEILSGLTEPVRQRFPADAEVLKEEILVKVNSLE